MMARNFENMFGIYQLFIYTSGMFIQRCTVSCIIVNMWVFQSCLYRWNSSQSLQYILPAYPSEIFQSPMCAIVYLSLM
jgi:hypothetical protein